MSGSHDDALENTVVLSSIFRMILGQTKLTQGAFTVLIKKYGTVTEIQDQRDSSITERVSDIFNAKAIIYRDEALFWRKAINQFLLGFTKQDLPRSAQAGAGKRKSKEEDNSNGTNTDSVIDGSENSIVKAKDIKDLDPKKLAEYRASVEMQVGVQGYIRPQSTQAFTAELARNLSGAWRMFRMAGEGELYFNMIFMHAEVGAYRARRVLFTADAQWVGEAFVSHGEQLIAYLSADGAFATTISTLPKRKDAKDKLTMAGLTMFQDRPDNDAVPIHVDLVFGYKIHNEDPHVKSSEVAISEELSKFCLLEGREKDACVAAALHVIKDHNAASRHRDVIARGFRRQRVPTGDLPESTSWEDVVRQLTDSDHDLADYLLNSLRDVKINGQSILKSVVPVLRGRFPLRP